MAGNSTQINFRTDEETKHVVQGWLDDRGIPSGQALGAIAEVLLSAETREKMPERGAEIDNFQSLVQQLMNAYTASLQMAQNTEARIRENYAKKLESQASMISDLQEKVKKVQDEATAEKEKIRTQIDSLAELTSGQAEEIKNWKKTAAEAVELREKVATLTKQLAEEKEKAEIEKDKAVFEERKRAQEEIAKVREASQLAVTAAQKNVAEIQAKAQENIQKLYEEMHKPK